ncbi:putative porin [Defluviicoccus vanus]|uniref:Putative porin n=1 Tax=Defluviicoccus vanus TaxID=111831 RepID=A0A7H1N0G0_9PROT|nr:putative porin [Defluviicoccus vanus]QNT69196.1 putative porin [Defluviicoccus vanus]
MDSSRHHLRPGDQGLRAPVSTLTLAIALACGGGDIAAATTAPTAVPSGVAAVGAANGGVLANLIRMLIRQGVITDEEGHQLLEEARAEAAANAANAAAASAAAPAAAGAAGVAGVAAGAAQASEDAGAVRVPYIPEPVRRQIREEVKKEVLAQAQAENWAAPNEVPSWVHRFTPYGDIRLRYEHDAFANNNASIVNFNAINTGQPYNIGANQTQNPPFFNTDEDRNRFLLRTRVGVEANVAEHVNANIRIASGNETTARSPPTRRWVRRRPPAREATSASTISGSTSPTYALRRSTG